MDRSLALVIAWLLFAALAGIVAKKRGHSGWGFALISLAISPLLGVILALVIKPSPKESDESKLASGRFKKMSILRQNNHQRIGSMRQLRQACAA